MSRFKQSINSVHTKDWVERVGKIVLNFSVIEMESMFWVVHLCERELEIKQIADSPFSVRVKLIIDQVDERAIGVSWRKKSSRAWNEALKLAQLRNQVAHNPIIFGWSSEPHLGVPNILGIPNLKARSSKNAQWLLSKEEADKSINKMALIAQTLAELRIEWCTTRDQGKAPPLKIGKSLWYLVRRYVGMIIYDIKKRRNY